MIIKSTDWNRTCIYMYFSTRERGSEREREGKSFGHVTINGRRLEIRTVWRRRVDYVYKHTHNISYWKMICARFTPITLFQTFWTTVFPNCLYLPFARSKFRFRFIISSPFPSFDPRTLVTPFASTFERTILYANESYFECYTRYISFF